MKIVKSTGFYKNEGIEDRDKPYAFVTFKPYGTFLQKMNGLLKLVHHKLIAQTEENEDGVMELSDYKIVKTKSRKKIRTLLSGLIKKRPKGVLMIYKYGTKNAHSYTNKKGFKKSTNVNQYGTRQKDSFKIISEFYSFVTDDPLTPENLIKVAVKDLMDRYYQYQVSLSDESEPWPLYSVSFKFI
jgi:hypothetical protein